MPLPMDAITISAAFQFVWEGTSRKDVHLGGSPAKANKSITVWKGELGVKSVQKLWESGGREGGREAIRDLDACWSPNHGMWNNEKI